MEIRSAISSINILPYELSHSARRSFNNFITSFHRNFAFKQTTAARNCQGVGVYSINRDRSLPPAEKRTAPVINPVRFLHFFVGE